jgi:hypothetical protein
LVFSTDAHSSDYRNLATYKNVKHLQIDVATKTGSMRKQVKFKCFNFPFERSSLDAFFIDKEPNLENLKKFLKDPQEPLNIDDKHYVEPKSYFVSTNPVDTGIFFKDNVAADKSYALVVAGESGSGKSVYTCQKSQEEGFESIYIRIKQDNLNAASKILTTFPCLHALFDIVLDSTTAEIVKHQEALRDLKVKLRWSKDGFALTVFEHAFDSVKAKAQYRMNQAVHDWLSKKELSRKCCYHH